MGEPSSAQQLVEPSQSVHHPHQYQSHWKFLLHHPCFVFSMRQPLQGRTDQCAGWDDSEGRSHLALQPWALRHGKVQHQCLRMYELMGSLCCAVLHIAVVRPQSEFVPPTDEMLEQLNRCGLH